jgi:hypothetical protein
MEGSGRPIHFRVIYQHPSYLDDASIPSKGTPEASEDMDLMGDPANGGMDRVVRELFHAVD